MSKKVLILSGSPRRSGNSDLLCDAFRTGAQEAGNTTEKIFLRDLEIGYCIACGGCRGRGECILKDDMELVLEKMWWADVIVMASPVYFYSINAQMKTLIDRTQSGWRKLDNKELYYIMTAAEDSDTVMDGALVCFRGFAACLNNATEKGVLCAKGIHEVGEVKNTQYIQEAYQMGKGV